MRDAVATCACQMRLGEAEAYAPEIIRSAFAAGTRSCLRTRLHASAFLRLVGLEMCCFRCCSCAEGELKTLVQWENKFKQQYPIVGYLSGVSKPLSQIDVW